MHSQITMLSQPDGMSTAFHRWQELTDDFIRQLDALQRQVPGASARLDRIGVELAVYSAEFTRDQTGRK